MRYTVYGGEKYGWITRHFDTLIEAASEYMHRSSSLATRYPGWGAGAADDHYVLMNENQWYTVKDLRTVVNGTFGYYS